MRDSGKIVVVSSLLIALQLGCKTSTGARSSVKDDQGSSTDGSGTAGTDPATGAAPLQPLVTCFNPVNHMGFEMLPSSAVPRLGTLQKGTASVQLQCTAPTDGSATLWACVDPAPASGTSPFSVTVQVDSSGSLIASVWQDPPFRPAPEISVGGLPCH